MKCRYSLYKIKPSDFEDFFRIVPFYWEPSQPWEYLTTLSCQCDDDYNYRESVKRYTNLSIFIIQWLSLMATAFHRR